MATVIATLSPSEIWRGKHALRPAQHIYLQRAKEIYNNGWTPTNINNPPPGAIIYPSIQDMYEWEKGLSGRKWFAVDIECAGPHITIIGLCRLNVLKSIVIWFRQCGGDPWAWSKPQLREIVTWLYHLFANPTYGLVFQNGQAFDVPEHLSRIGFAIGNFTFDTMLAQHIAFPEMPKSLAFTSNLYLGAENWKGLTKNLSTGGEGK